MTLLDQKQARYHELCTLRDNYHATDEQLTESIQLSNELVGCEKIMAFSNAFFTGGDGSPDVEILSIQYFFNPNGPDHWTAQIHVKRTIDVAEFANNVNITLYDDDPEDKRIVLEYL